MPKTSELCFRVRQEMKSDRRGDIEYRFTLFKCACVRLIVPHEPSYLETLEALESQVLWRVAQTERRPAASLEFIDPKTATPGMSPRAPCDISARALDRAIGESGPKPVARVINTCLMWARFNAKQFGEDMQDGWREMEALMTLLLDRILDAETLEHAAAACRKPVRIASDCVVH